ncbi:hypothetical protein AVEN_258020-1 [Araneus ventricosus]|uniref:Transmembrane protein 242 n=1 Tax=Araneus ventricosus TaxID=182803 RepID=A0A4Y2NSJ7_ARAVE|nr:hypothetical protein AVEN_258020-1 [Araneus ventricosus]
MASRRSVPKFPVTFLLLIVWSFVGSCVAARYQRPLKAGSWKTLTGGLKDSSVLLIGGTSAFISGWIAVMASKEEIPNIAAFPLISVGGAVFYFGCAAAMNFIFTKK